jgi:RNA polymerase sigma factor for flagellar operon FliA
VLEIPLNDVNKLAKMIPEGPKVELKNEIDNNPELQKELKHVLAAALKTLTQREQMVMSLYYYDELTLKEIAEILGVTESRVSQIHSKVILSLRTKLKNTDLN